MNNYDKMMKKLKDKKAIEREGNYMKINSTEKVKEEIEKLEDTERQGTINDIENLIEDSYESMYHELSKNYNYIKEENELQREQIQEMLSDIWKIECEEIIEEMNTLINEKMKKINEIVKKYKWEETTRFFHSIYSWVLHT